MIRVSAGIVRYPDGRILICRRGEGRKNAHLWEFPGGKQEAGESPEDALRRELMEELSLPIADVSPLCRREAQGIAFDFLTAAATAEPVLTEHEDYAFVHPADMTKYVFCPADEVVAQQIAFANVRACLWDFDGTLMDTYPLLTDVFVRVAAENGVILTAENALSLLKGTLRDACSALSGVTDASAEDLLAQCRAGEAAHLLDSPKLVDGIADLLRSLAARGVRHYVVTHRDLRCRDMLDKCGILPLFSGFITHEDGYPRKPAPEMVQGCLARYGLTAAECVMIGDRPLDTRAGQAAGVRGILLDADGRFSGESSCEVRASSVAEIAEMLLPDWTHPNTFSSTTIHKEANATAQT